MQDMLRYLYGEKINNHIPSIDADTSEGRTVLEETALAYMGKLNVPGVLIAAFLAAIIC